jgi:hypothetical protein
VSVLGDDESEDLVVCAFHVPDGRVEPCASRWSAASTGLSVQDYTEGVDPTRRVHQDRPVHG